jgi:hypothetical protein
MEKIMDRITRYENIIIASMKMHQARKEIEQFQSVINDNLLVSEAKDKGNFNISDVRKAFKVLPKDFKFVDNLQYIKSRLVYKDIEVSLHSEAENLSGDAIRHIMDGE